MTKGFKKLAYRAAHKDAVKWDPEGVTGWLQAGAIFALTALILVGMVYIGIRG